MAEFISLYSGSSGNCSAVRCGERFLLIDMGKSCKRTGDALKEAGLRLSNCDGILVTHEHSDHVGGLNVFLRQCSKRGCPMPVYCSQETRDDLYELGILPDEAVVYSESSTDGPFAVGDFSVEIFHTSHDVPCSGFRIHTPDGKIMSIATDLGTLRDRWGEAYRAMFGCDLVVLESNYDEQMLTYGPYSYSLKQRVRSTKGHLSNDECSSMILELVQDGCRQFALCHLSKENNTPTTAMLSILSVLQRAGIDPAEACNVTCLLREDVTPPIIF